MRSMFRLLLFAASAAVVTSAACRQAPPIVPEVVALRADALPASPDDDAWDRAPVHVAKMVPQDLVEPRLLQPTTAEVTVRALTDGADIVFRLDWADESPNNRPGPAQMVDACAVQIPQTPGPEPPAPQMGEQGKIVEITYWRADWQASVDGRGDTIRDLYPNASIDHYPFDAAPKGSEAQKQLADLYAPARALGNIRSGPRSVPVEDLVADGPGTLSPAPPRGSSGKGVHGAGTWSVVIRRKWPAGVAVGQRTSVAFAVWQGSKGEVGARKMRTGWVPLLARGES